MNLSKTREIAAKYQQKLEPFSKQHDELLSLFKGTPLAKDMEAIQETVDEAYTLNVQADWLSDYGPFGEGDYFNFVDKQDYRGRLIKSMDDIPVDFRSEFDDMNETEFAFYMKELREGCRNAYTEMRMLKDDLPYKLVAEHFLDMLCCLPEGHLAECEIDIVQPFFDNLSELWDKYERNAKCPMCMTNELGINDYDPKPNGIVVIRLTNDARTFRDYPSSAV